MAHFAKTFEEYGVIEKNHDFLLKPTLKQVGDPVDSYISDSPMTLELINGEEVTYPTGTWFATIEVTDPETIHEVKNGVYNGVSMTSLDKEDADKLKKYLNLNVSAKNSEGQLISERENGVAFGISLAKNPCVHKAKFCRIAMKQNKGEFEMENENEKNLFEKIGDYFGIEPVKPVTSKALAEAIENATTKSNEKIEELESQIEDLKSQLDESSSDETDESEETEEVEEGSDEEVIEEEEIEQIDASTKSNPVHNAQNNVSVKSDTQIIMETMGRDPITKHIKNGE